MPTTVTGRGYPHEGVVSVEYMTVGDIIDALTAYDSNLPIGFVGHFGELHAFDPSDIYDITLTRVEHHWKGAEAHPFRAVIIEAPDVGPEPD